MTYIYLHTHPHVYTHPSPIPPPPHTQLDEESILLLLQLLRLNSPTTKTLLQRLLINLLAYNPLNDTIMRLLLASLRAPLTFDDHVDVGNERGGGGADVQPLIGLKDEVCVCVLCERG